MARQYTRFDGMKFPPYVYKPYPKLITVGQGKDAKRVRVHDADEEKAAVASAGGTKAPAVAPPPAAAAQDPAKKKLALS